MSAWVAQLFCHFTLHLFVFAFVSNLHFFNFARNAVWSERRITPPEQSSVTSTMTSSVSRCTLACTLAAEKSRRACANTHTHTHTHTVTKSLLLLLRHVLYRIICSRIGKRERECVCVWERERERERACGSKEKFRNQLSKDESVEKSCKTKIKIHELFFSKRPE